MEVGWCMTLGQDQSRPDSVTLLDCTLRDGGYYNDWDYPTSLVQRYLHAVGAARIPIVEMGFRTLGADQYLGPTAHTTDRYLEALDIPPDLTVGVMLNAKEIVAGDDPARAIDSVFSSADSSPVGLVRFAAHFAELEALVPGIERLHELGYTVGLNLMQIASQTNEQIAQFGELVEQLDIRVAYFADSFGGMQPRQVVAVVEQLRQSFTGDIGCHMHDNMSLAFANTLAAIDVGATFADGTLLGMGRGPGNARTEYLAIELARRGLADVDAVPLLPLVEGEFAEMQRHYGWGTSPYYFLSAAYGIHPTYIQEMTKDGRYSVGEIVSAVDDLARTGGANFSRVRMETAASALGIEQVEGTWDATGWCAGETLLIIGPGPNGVAQRRDIESYIRSKDVRVVALNAVPPVDRELVDLVAICHPVRAVIDVADIKSWSQPVAIPSGLWERAAGDEPLADERDYGMTIEPGHLEARATSCTIPRVDAFPYALALALVGGAAEVQLTGFDGFDASNPRQQEMVEVFEMFAQLPGAPRVVSLTRTNYPIDQSSIYAP